MKTLKELGVIPVTSDELRSVFPKITALNQKLFSLEKNGEIIRLKRGVYVVSPTVTGMPLSLELISNHLYGPSYVSRESALAYYGLIPERVRLIRAVTIKHARLFKNAIGNFEYVSVPPEYFSVGISFVSNNSYSFLIASPEKALCDLIVMTPHLNLRYRREIITFLESNLRFDMETFFLFDPMTFRQAARCGRKAVCLNRIADLLERKAR